MDQTRLHWRSTLYICGKSCWGVKSYSSSNTSFKLSSGKNMYLVGVVFITKENNKLRSKHILRSFFKQFGFNFVTCSSGAAEGLKICGYWYKVRMNRFVHIWFDGLARVAFPTGTIIEILEEFHSHLICLPLCIGILIGIPQSSNFLIWRNLMKCDEILSTEKY